MYGIPVRGWFANNWQWIALIVVIGFAINQWTANQNVQALIDLNTERAADAAKYAELEKLNASILADQAGFRKELAVKDAEIEAIKAENVLLEGRKQAVNLTALLMKSENALLKLFKETYPAVARDRGLGIIELTEGAITLPYMVIPAWFAEGFIVEHDHLKAANEQLAGYRKAEELYGDVRTVNEKYLKSETLRATAYQDGQRECAASHEVTRSKLEESLRQPRIDIPNKWGWIGGLAIGGITCGAITGKIRF